MICRILLVLILLTFVAQSDYADIAFKVDENGTKIFYNIPTNRFAAPAETKTSRIYYSRRAESYQDLIQRVSQRHGVDDRLVKAVIQVESNFNEGAKSPKGACGLMQLMPATASRFGVSRIFDPQQNVEGGVRYLSHLMQLFESDLTLAVAAYNAGEGAVQRFNNQVPNYNETQNYVRKVLALYQGKNTYTVQKPAKPAPPAVYFKYLDANGIVHYQQTPPAGRESTTITFYN